jgi:non-ribosomal peptide synthase protein (TIGR01720 family)
LLRYLCSDENLQRQLSALPPTEVSFNYFGQLGQKQEQTAIAAADEGPSRSSRGKRRHKLEINGSVANGQLTMIWTYSEAYHRRATIEKVAADFIAALRALIEHCQSADAGGYTPSDFPEVELSQDKLDAVLAELELGEDSK